MIKYTIFFLFFSITICAQNLHQEDRQYEYGNLNRLSRVVFSNGTIYDYVYDNLGNRAGRLVTEPPALTYVPDDAFEQRLIDLGYDDVMDDYVITNDINQITILYVSDLGISDLTGIEDFSALVNFECLNNSLTSIDISQNLNLERLYCAYNQIMELDVSNNTNLKYLYCFDNQLSTLDVSNNSNLRELSCDYNDLVSLDVSQNSLLENLVCGVNLFDVLDVTNNSNLKHLGCLNLGLVELNLTNNNLLESLSCSNNDLTSIDLSNHPQMNYLECFSNNLEELNLKNGNNQIFSYMRAQNNVNLSCIQVDDETAANNGTGVYANWEVDNQVQYSEDCEFLDVDDNDLKGISLYPNPTENNLFLSLPKYVGLNLKYSLFDLNGKLVKQNFVIVDNINLDIDVSSLSSGTYIIQVLINNRAWSSNFIKN